MLKSLKLLADPTRLRILRLLDREPLSVADLQEVLGMGQSRISTQLSQLKGGGLVGDERSGKNNIYRSEMSSELSGLVRDASTELPEARKDDTALRHLLRKRQDKSRAYFDELAGRFGKDYVPGRSWKGLAEALLKVMAVGTVADLGAGEGTLSQLLAQRAEKVIAVDLSEKMVAFGTQLAREHGLANLEYRAGDLENPPLEPGEINLAVLSQALHHAASPQRALDAAFQALRSGGQLVILDLLQHQFEEARELYADTWLGFGEAELAAMLEKSGFTGIETAVVDREAEPPHFQTLLAVARKK
ncbi:metalloregulator ArsR/SmtB family transcription factor [Haloferula sp. A504]|uniref:metalloregulator ArsR/SmtB family transcription factor n=1 Tax=Haloferula sp. A504 TaxID=3373601 RepID=UPI0031BEE756|nr:metalloregulator ArsR/SmtB family transcription factor [Verrucomicrobiaceae bacterium E54]